MEKADKRRLSFGAQIRNRLSFGKGDRKKKVNYAAAAYDHVV